MEECKKTIKIESSEFETQDENDLECDGHTCLFQLRGYKYRFVVHRDRI